MEGKTVKWGIIGTGYIARNFAAALKVVENSELIAVGSRNQATAKRFADDLVIKKYYGSYEELVRDQEIDIVYIATPHNLHCENTLLALENNKSVLCEKPLAVNYNEAKLMIEKARQKKLFLMEALWSRFLPNIIKVKEIVDNGTIGQVKLLSASFAFRSTQGPEQRHFNIDLCGGTLLDTGIYNVFLSLFLFGKPKSVISSANLSASGIDLSASYTFNYQDSISIMYSSFQAETPIIAEIHGEKGKVQLQHEWFKPGSVKLILNNGIEENFAFDVLKNGFEYEAIEAAKCLLGGIIESSMWSHKNSLELLELIDEIRRQCNIKYPNHDRIY